MHSQPSLLHKVRKIQENQLIPTTKLIPTGYYNNSEANFTIATHLFIIPPFEIHCFVVFSYRHAIITR